MRHANGAGLAANQVGVPVRIATIEVGDNPRYPYKPRIPLTVVVNPIIEPIDDELVEINEGCLSVPNLRGSVMRHVNVRVRYLDRDGVAHDEIRRGLTAGTFQHECDHLDGMLFLDRVVDPTHLHHVGAVRTIPPRRVRRADHRVRRPSGIVTAEIVTTYWCELAWLGDLAGEVERGVAITVDGDRITDVRPLASSPSTDAQRLAGLTLPGMANAHSHAFHRALRGRTHGESRFVLDVARPHVHACRSARPRLVPCPGHGDVRRDGAGRFHLRRRVPLPAPRPRWRAVFAAERDGPGPARRQRRTQAFASPCSTPAISGPE